jgi:DNA-binding transcriptional ArsR family regulator
VDDDRASALSQALSNPLRLAILRQLRGRGRMSPSEFAAGNGRALGNVSYHFRALEAAGVIALVDQQPRRGAIENFYAVSGPNGADALTMLDLLASL